MLPPAARTWQREYIARTDPDTGARIVQMTSAPMIHENIYPEAPVFTPDSRYFIYSRRQAPDHSREYWLADLTTLHVRKLTDEPNVKAPAITPDGQWMYYIKQADDIELKRVSLETYERETVMRTELIQDAYALGTIRHDAGAYVTCGTVKGESNLWAIVRFDLKGLRAHIILQSDQICNAHPQYARGPAQDLLIQENHGCKFDEQGRCVALASGYGADLHVIDDQGDSVREVALGRSDTEMIQGHQCWVGRTERILSTLVRRDSPDDTFRSDRIVVTTPGAQDREVVGMGRRFSHPNASEDGCWWVCDELDSADVFVGSMRTHEYDLLVRTQASFGAPQYTHPHPAFSPDASKVLFNSDATGVPQVYVAWVPDGILARLVSG